MNSIPFSDAGELTGVVCRYFSVVFGFFERLLSMLTFSGWERLDWRAPLSSQESCGVENDFYKTHDIGDYIIPR